jgi:hypothetical protein
MATSRACGRSARMGIGATIAQTAERLGRAVPGHATKAITSWTVKSSPPSPANLSPFLVQNLVALA